MVVAALVFILHVAFVLGGPSEGCGGSMSENPQPGQNHRYSVQVSDPDQGEVRRDYILHLPANYDPSNNVAVPLLLDYHGWSRSADIQMDLVPWAEVADMDETGFIYVSMDGMNDIQSEGNYGSWNVSATMGPLGLTCDPVLVGDYPCYKSCASQGDCGYLVDSCDWTSCHDDIIYTEAVLYDITAKLCIDTDQIHVSGMSNGGMFIWTRIMERLAATVASAGTVCSSPLRGYNPMPDSPVNIIDFHGLQDNVIPYSPESPGNLGEGPDMTTETNDGYYYHIKPDHLTKVLSSMNCNNDSSVYPTSMDGVDMWSCQIWSGCDEGKEVVSCTANYGHDYPFSGQIVEGLKIMWDFMKTHSKTV